MEVKCPKCRYRFDTPAEAGVTELACVCPRCGTPFAYTVPEELVGIDKKIVDSASESESASVANSQSSQSSASNDAMWNERDVESEERERDNVQRSTSNVQRSNSNVQSSNSNVQRPTSNVQRSTSKGCRRGCFVLVFLFLLFFYIVRSCGNTASYSGENYGSDADTEVSNDRSDNDDDNDVDEFSEIKPETPPSWIQGKWTANAEFGKITLRIRGDKISETAGGETASGMFYYKKGKLYCDFGDGEVFVYRLDSDNRRIDAGRGILMRKAGK